jgi:hypothetical protein
VSDITRSYETVEDAEAALWAQADVYRGDDTEVLNQVDQSADRRATAPKRTRRSKRARKASPGRGAAITAAIFLFLSASLGPALSIGVIFFSHRALRRGMNAGPATLWTRALVVAGWLIVAGWASQIAFNAYFFGSN